MSILDDSQLKSYEDNYDKLLKSQTKTFEDIKDLQKKKAEEIKKIEDRYDSDIRNKETEIEYIKRQIPEAESNIERRRKELKREEETKMRKAA